MKIKTIIQKGFKGDTAIGITINDSVVTNIYPKTFRGQRYYESDRFAMTYDSITNAKEHIKGLAEEGHFKGEFRP